MKKLFITFTALISIVFVSSTNTTSYEQSNPNELDYDYVHKMIIKHKVSNPKVVMAQSILETGHYTSKLAIRNNNLFGLSKNGKLIKFKSVDHSIWYYKQFQNKRYEPHRDLFNNYMDFLNNIPYIDHYKNDTVFLRYAEDLQYTDKLEDVMGWMDRKLKFKF